MNTVSETTNYTNAEDFKPVLFQVWIDTNCGFAEPDWYWNSEPKLLQHALVEAAECRARRFPTKILPEGMNPRPDGRWDNPV